MNDKLDRLYFKYICFEVAKHCFFFLLKTQIFLSIRYLIGEKTYEISLQFNNSCKFMNGGLNYFQTLKNQAST